MAETPLEAEEAGTVPPADSEPLMDVGSSPDPTSAPEKSGGSGPVLFRDHFLIDINQPLPELDSPSAKAYAVEDRRDLGSKLFGLICTPGLPTRIDAIRQLKNNFLPGILPMVEWDVVYWPPLGESSMVIVYKVPLGGRVIERLAKKHVKITEYDLPRRIVEPLTQGLQIFDDWRIPHRAIRPNNVFFLDEEMTEVVLGDCVTSPPGFDQPIIYEPLERAMASPGGRGRGNISDDIFALGATCVPIMLGYNPVATIKEEELIRSRLEHGSYTTLCGNARIPLQLMEPLHGMMQDDPKRRWDLNEISHWLSGEKGPSVKKISDLTANAPFTFKEHDHYKRRALARHFNQHPADAAKAIRDEEFRTWLRRDLEAAPLANAIKSLIDNANLHTDDYQGTDDYLVACVTMRMDPSAPICYKGVSFMLDGFGPLLAVEMLRKGDASAPLEAFSHGLHTNWFTNQSTPLPVVLDRLQRFLARLKNYLLIKDPGHGIERLLYESNESLPCQSTLVAEKYVIDAERLLPALDETANQVESGVQPMDHHIAAFIAARFDEDIDPHLKALASPKPDTSVIGMLSLLAFLQWKLKVGAVLGLSSWVGGLLGPAINTYHNRMTRRTIESEIPRLVRQGSLPELFDLIDNAEKRREDRDGFEAAKAEWVAMEEEIRDIEGSGEERLTKAERSGQQAAAIMSIVMSMIVVTFMFLVEVW